MNRRFENTTLWQRTLAIQPTNDPEEANRARLRMAYETFRERAGILAGEIAINHPEFTVHDITHLDALWEMAQLISGPDFPLTPAEAFVLGGAFLIHDLGMGLASYPEGITEIEQESIWIDTVSALLKEQSGKTPTLHEISRAHNSIRMRATKFVLRELHAKHAERLALISWKNSSVDSCEYYLIDDPVLRKTYGKLIGKIAHSHWLSAEKLIEYLPNTVGAPGGFSNHWTVDPIKLACILRTADASHLDERRAPGFLSVLRNPVDVSADHWIFQGMLYQPRLESDRLVYTSKESFPVEKANAWWTAYDALKVVDNELRHVDALLADSMRPRLSARGVSYIEDPMRLAKLIGTADWLPIDAKLKVGDVAKLVKTLGGEKLYGKNFVVPLRELIQNASDAVRARRVMEGKPSNWGQVIVRTGQDRSGQWIEVEDSGIGMSESVLTGPFLDFGTSFWGTPLMHRELPGLESKGFVSTGQFGIGFYSVFMWGDKVSVVTRRAERARDETIVLEFQNGLSSRPIIRKAASSEFLREGGTRIRVWGNNQDFLRQLLSDSVVEQPWTLEERCAWLCPTLDVDLFVEAKESKLVVGASDWITIKGSKLLRRILGPARRNSGSSIVGLLEGAGRNLRIIKDASGRVVGRACISPVCVSRRGVAHDEFYFSGIVTIGGFRSSHLSGVWGCLVGKPHTAARNIGIPVAESSAIGQWATDQARIALEYNLSSEQQVTIASYVRALNGSTEGLCIAESAAGWKSAADIACDLFDGEVIIVQDAAISSARREHGDLSLMKNVFSVNVGIPGILQHGLHGVWIEWPERDSTEDGWGSDWSIHSRTLEGAIIESFAKAWFVSLAVVLKNTKLSTDRKPIERKVCRTCSGEVLCFNVDVLKEPKPR